MNETIGIPETVVVIPETWVKTCFGVHVQELSLSFRKGLEEHGKD